VILPRYSPHCVVSSRISGRRSRDNTFLERFLHAHAGLLEGERLAAFKTLLDYGDDELWGLVSGRRECSSSSTGPWS